MDFLPVLKRDHFKMTAAHCENKADCCLHTAALGTVPSAEGVNQASENPSGDLEVV